MTTDSRSDETGLQRELVGFIRAFGLLSDERTPCGQPMAASDAHALSEIAAGGVAQRELVDRLQLDRSSVSRLVERLVQRGWVRRSSAARDRRTVRLEVTPAGREAAGRLAVARARRFESLLAGVPAESRAGVVDAIRLLTEAARASNERKIDDNQ